MEWGRVVKHTDPQIQSPEFQILGPHPRPTEMEPLVLKPRNLHFKNIPGF